MRFAKQLIYGVLYLAILFFIGGGIYVLNKPAPTCFDNVKNQGEEETDCGGPCESCAIRRLTPLRAMPVSLFASGDRTVALLEIRNPNPAFGAVSVPYTLRITSAAGEGIFTIERVTALYPGAIKHLLETNLPFAVERAAEAEITLGAPRWRSAEEFPRAEVNVQEVRLEEDIERQQLAVLGEVVNEDPAELAEVTVIAVIANDFGAEVAASKSVLLDVVPFERRAFRVVLPHPGETPVRLDQARVFVEARREGE